MRCSTAATASSSNAMARTASSALRRRRYGNRGWRNGTRTASSSLPRTKTVAGAGNSGVRSRAMAGRSPAVTSASPRNARRSDTWVSFPTWPRCGTGWAGSWRAVKWRTAGSARSTCSATPASARWRSASMAQSLMSMLRRSRSRRRARTQAFQAWRTAQSAGWSTMPPSLWRARCDASGATTGSSSIRPSSGAVPRARCGGWKTICLR